MTFPILSVMLFAPLAGSVVVLCLPKSKPVLIKWAALILSFIPLCLAAWVWFSYDRSQGGMQFRELHPWIQAIGVNYHLAVDGISVPMVCLTALLTTLSLFYSFIISERPKEYFAFFLLLETAMMGVFMALDFFLFYIFWELSLVPMYFLIGIWGGPRREYAAIKFFLYTLVGSVAMLLAIIAMYLTTHTWDIQQMSAARPFAGNPALAAMAFWAVFLGFAIKVPVFPFHTWLPDAHVEAPTAGSVILAGILLKLGAYGMIRILLPIFPDSFRTFAPHVATLATISIVYGALVAMAQWDLKKLIAYSSVNHMGYVMLGVAAAAAVGAGDEAVRNSQAIALNGAVLQMWNHGIITGALFFLVGVIYERAHTRDLKAFGGLGAKVPVYAGILTVTTFASLGLPGLAGFISEFLVFRGAFALLRPFAIISSLGIVVSAAYLLWKVIQQVLLGPLNERWAKLTDMNAREVITLAPLVVFMLLFGLYPAAILDLINQATTALVAAL
ncbi:MAG: complex I subunit 4 family protein [Anaerolineae bacterium]